MMYMSMQNNICSSSPTSNISCNEETVKTLSCTSTTKLNLPVLPSEFLELDFFPSEKLEGEEAVVNGYIYPFAVCSPFLATVVKAQQLTCGEDVKKVVDVCLDIQDSGIEFQPGDTIGVIPQNPKDEVEKLLKHLKILERADTVVSLSVKPGTVKKKACVPAYIPKKSTLRNILQNCLDIRAVPKKIFLRVLSAYTEVPSERHRLEELCSKEGSAQYSQYVVADRTTLVDLLETFPSCCPPVERLIEHLPFLQARPYSIANSPIPKTDGHRELHFVFSLLEFAVTKQVHSGSRYGICTGWLDSLTKTIQTPRCDHDSLSEELKKLSLQNKSLTLKVPLYLRKSTGFNLPEDPSVPLILIGPGTGVAPFMGFLQHRLAKQQRIKGVAYGDIWLFFGCRYEDKDFVYRSELKKYIEKGILTHLFTSFSRDRRKEKPRYVQDNIKLHGREFVRQIFEKNCIIYVCGDAKNMRKDVFDAIVSVIQNERGIEEHKAIVLVNELQTQKRYLQDIWI